MPAAVALEDAVQDTAYAMPDWSTLTAVAAPEEKPKHREYLGPGLRFAAGFLLAAAFCLLVLSVADTWWRFRAQLAIPLNDGGVTNAFGGVALTYRQYCPRFSNATMNSGQPIIAPLTCFAVQLDLSQPPSVQPAYNTQYSRGVLACVAISMLTCLLALFLLVTAPSEAERKAGVAARAALASGTPAERQARGLAVTFTVDEDGGTQLRAAAPSCLLRTLRCVAGCQHRAVACLPLHALLPLLLAPSFTATIALSGLWVDGMASIPPETLIGALANITCAADSPLCNEYLTLPGPGLVGAMVGCVAMLMACLLSILAWAFPTCCPRLYESVGDGGKDSSGAAGRHGGPGFGGSPHDDDDDDDEDDMLIRITPLKAVMKSINVVETADASAGAAAVAGTDGATAVEGAATGEVSTGVVLVPDAAAAAASATAAARSLVIGAASVVSAAQRGTVTGSVAGPAFVAGSGVPSRESSRSFLPLVLGRLGELAAVAAGAAAAGGAGAAAAPGASSTSADPSAVVAAAAAAAQSGASGPGSAASLEHPALRVHAGLVALLRLGALATLALYAASYFVQWWSFTFADADEGVYWGGGVGVNYLQVDYEPQDERKWYSLSVALRFAVAPLVSLAAPTILAALCVTLAAAAAVCAFAVLLPLDNFFVRLLLWSPCQHCRCARGTVCGRATAQLRAQLGLREATAASALFAPFGSVAIFPAEAGMGGMGGMGGLGIDGLGLGIAGASSGSGGLGSSGSGSGGADVSMETIHGGSAAAADGLLGGPGAGAGLGLGGRFGGSSAAFQSLLGPGPADGVHALLAGAASASAPARPGFAGDDASIGAADVASAAAASSLPASAAARDHEVGTAAPAGTVGPSGLGFQPYDDGAAAAAATLVLLHSCRAVDRLAAGTCFAHAAGGCALLASAIFLGAAGTFDWDGFLFTYLDPMHLPDVVYKYQLGPGPIMLLFAAALALCVGGVLIYLWHKRYRTLTLLLRAAIVRREDILA